MPHTPPPHAHSEAEVAVASAKSSPILAVAATIYHPKPQVGRGRKKSPRLSRTAVRPSDPLLHALDVAEQRGIGIAVEADV